MQPAWLKWLGFVVLAALISVTSCQVWQGPDATPSAEGAVE